MQRKPTTTRPPAPLAHPPRRDAAHVRRMNMLWFAVVLGVSASLSTPAVAVASESAAACVGDCNDSGAVSVAELVNGVNIALGTRTLDGCRQFDCNGAGRVTIDCLLKAVGAALNGCSPLPTGSPTHTSGAATATASPIATSTPTSTATV